MKSPQIASLGLDAAERERYSEMKVMRSNAGWYVGSTYDDPEIGCKTPGTRDSDYHRTEGDAARTLSVFVATGITTRPYP